MPPINRDKNTEYVILIVTDGTKKILDITTEKNRRNYKFKIMTELKTKADKRNPVYQEFKNSNVDAIDIEVLDNINGTYLDALKYMDKIATKYNYKTTKAINTSILDMQIELKATKTNEEPVMENEEVTIKHTTPPAPIEEHEAVGEPQTPFCNTFAKSIEEPEEEPVKVEVKAEVKKPKKAVQKIKLKPVEEQLNEPQTLIEKAINTPLTPKINIHYEADEELEPAEYKVILPSLNKQNNTPTTSGIVKATKKQATKPPVVIEIDRDEDEDKEVTPPKPKLTKKQEQQKNKLIEDNTQTINEYDTLKKQKESLERKMNTLHLAIINNYTTLANTFNYVDGSISDFNFE